MEETKLLQLQQKVVEYLKENDVGSVADVVVGYNMYPESKSENEELIYVQNSLLLENLVVVQNNRLNGFKDLNLTELGYNKEFSIVFATRESLVRKFLDQQFQAEKEREAKFFKANHLKIQKDFELNLIRKQEIEKERRQLRNKKILKKTWDIVKFASITLSVILTLLATLLAIFDSGTFKQIYTNLFG